MVGYSAFGKIPALGDFFRVDASQAFVDPWDAWLQDEMVNTKNSLGANWENRYMSAPIWRFAIGAGQAGSTPTIGVLMASVDRVGRKFPLTLFSQLAPSTSVSAAFFAAQTIYPLLEDTALDALEDDYSRDQLADALSNLNTITVQSPSRITRAGGVLTVQGGAIDELQNALCGYSLSDYSSPCIWSAQGQDGFHTMITEGLPRGDQSRALFDLSSPIWNFPPQDGVST